MSQLAAAVVESWLQRAVPAAAVAAARMAAERVLQLRVKVALAEKQRSTVLALAAVVLAELVEVQPQMLMAAMVDLVDTAV